MAHRPTAGMDSTLGGTRGGGTGTARPIAIAVAIALTVAGLVVSNLVSTPATIAIDGTAVFSENYEQSRTALVVSFAVGYVGMALVGAVYLAVTDRGWSFLDVRIPSLRDWLWAVGGVVGSFVVLQVVSLVSQSFDVTGAGHQLIGTIEADPSLALVFVALVFLFNAPVEEFLFRNVIQKRLYEAFTTHQAIVVASVVFAVVHFPVYYVTASSLLSVSVPLFSVFGGSLIFGYLFVKTENLVVPTLAHAGFNSFQFLLLYVFLEYFPEVYEESQAAAVLAVAALPF